jgi:hypothetical protein
VERLIELLRDIGLILGIIAIAIGVIEVRTHSAYGGITRHLELLAIPCLHRLDASKQFTNTLEDIVCAFSISMVQIGHIPCSLPTWYN